MACAKSSASLATRFMKSSSPARWVTRKPASCHCRDASNPSTQCEEDCIARSPRSPNVGVSFRDDALQCLLMKKLSEIDQETLPAVEALIRNVGGDPSSFDGRLVTQLV